MNEFFNGGKVLHNRENSLRLQKSEGNSEQLYFAGSATIDNVDNMAAMTYAQ